VCVAFAGGDLAVGPVTVPMTALAVRVGGELIRLGDPVLGPVRTSVGDERWHVRGRSARWSVELEATAPIGDAAILPVPLPAEQRMVPGALEHLAGRMTLEVRRTRGRLVYAGETRLAGLEHGGLARAQAELSRRAAAAAA
jgi:hypothetical protein